MACATTNAKILVRRDTSTNWYATNPILLSGEQGYETNTGKMKIGDGIRPWCQLPYFVGSISTIFLDAGKPDTSYILCPTLLRYRDWETDRKSHV